MITIEAPVAARAHYLLGGYHHLLTDKTDMIKLIKGMRHRHGFAITQNWQAFFDAEDWLELAKALLTDHYDPAYDSSVGRHTREVRATLIQKDCLPQTIAQTADNILNLKWN
jgi:tRNA 2-selenouridine synthase